MAFGSAHKGNIIAADGSVRSNEIITKNLKSFFSTISSNSYLVLDGNYKYVYDRWNDVYKYIPCNTDVAGLVADTAIRNQPWFSPADSLEVVFVTWQNLFGTQVSPIEMNCILTESTLSYHSQVKVQFLEIRQHFQLHLHSTELTSVNSSCFERAIEEAAKAQLFELNDEVTRGVFRSIVEPFLRDVQSRRGITDFLVVCDETNNTPAVIDANEFSLKFIFNLHVQLTSLR